MITDQIPASQQENLITLVCFDDERCKIIRNVVPVELFESFYRDVASRAYLYIDRFGQAPKEHISDELHDVLEGENSRRARSMSAVLRRIYEGKSYINPEYTMAKLTAFVRQQEIKKAIIQSADLLQSKGADGLDEIESILRESSKRRLDMFDPGVFLSDRKRSFRFLDRMEDALPTGIPELDHRRLGPTRKALHLFIGLLKRGKSWWLIHLGVLAAMRRLRVIHISLEMSEEQVVLRYYQTLFSIAKRGETLTVTELKSEERGASRYMKGFSRREVQPKLSLDINNIAEKLGSKVDRFSRRILGRILIKDFPTGKLTVRQLEAYLDLVEDSHGFVPDLLIVDYPDLFSHGSHRETRDALDRIFIDLRGIAMERNIAVATVSQSNRAGLGATKVTEKNIAEAFTKAAHADTVITFSQTGLEKRLGLARLFVSNARSDADNLTVLITQNYAFGQFVTGSALMKDDYFKALQAFGGEDGEEEADGSAK